MIKVDDRKVVIFVILFIILLTFMSQVSAINSLTVLGEHLFEVGGCIAHLCLPIWDTSSSFAVVFHGILGRNKVEKVLTVTWCKG